MYTFQHFRVAVCLFDSCQLSYNNVAMTSVLRQRFVRKHQLSAFANAFCLLDVDVDDCSRLELSCENGGQAVDTGRSCKCRCTDEYSGEHCELGKKLFVLKLVIF